MYKNFTDNNMNEHENNIR